MKLPVVSGAEDGSQDYHDRDEAPAARGPESRKQVWHGNEFAMKCPRGTENMENHGCGRRPKAKMDKRIARGANFWCSTPRA